VLIKSLNGNKTNNIDRIFYNNDSNYSGHVGHRGMGVTFDADLLSKIEYELFLLK
jgi:hypothetical protein